MLSALPLVLGDFGYQMAVADVALCWLLIYLPHSLKLKYARKAGIDYDNTRPRELCENLPESKKDEEIPRLLR